MSLQHHEIHREPVHQLVNMAYFEPRSWSSADFPNPNAGELNHKLQQQSLDPRGSFKGPETICGLPQTQGLQCRLSKDRPACKRSEVCIVVIATASTLKVLGHLQEPTPFATCATANMGTAQISLCMQGSRSEVRFESQEIPWPPPPPPNMAAKCFVLS